MKQMQSDTYTIAWFKIAECVSRGEKERALGVYRLLSHSFNDSALARQLEADIYLSFDEKEHAIVLYYQASELYEKSQRILEASAVCEHIITILPQDIVIRKKIIEMYTVLNNASKIIHHMKYIIDHYIQKNDAHALTNIVTFYQHNNNYNLRALVYTCIINTLHLAQYNTAIILHCIEGALEGLLFLDDKHQLQEFLSTLSALDEEWYVYACSYLEKN